MGVRLHVSQRSANDSVKRCHYFGLFPVIPVVGWHDNFQRSVTGTSAVRIWLLFEGLGLVLAQWVERSPGVWSSTDLSPLVRHLFLFFKSKYVRC